MIEPGLKVTYMPEHGDPEQGIIKSVPADDPEHVFVVYHVGNYDWDNYENYTAARTPIKDLIQGWPEDPNDHFTFGLHSDKDSNNELFIDLLMDERGMTRDQALEYVKNHDLSYTGYEVIFTCILTPEGNALATHVDGVKLEKPLKLN